MSDTKSVTKITFWDHLDELRGTLLRIFIALVLFAWIAFMFKDFLFDIVLAPKSNHFVTYRLLDPFTNLLPFQSQEL